MLKKKKVSNQESNPECCIPLPLGKKLFSFFSCCSCCSPLLLQLTITMTANVTIKIAQYVPQAFWSSQFLQVLFSQRFNMLRSVFAAISMMS
jgi:hypothetical protein